MPLAMLADFTAGTAGSALEQWISEGEVSARKSITSGLTNAVSGAIYGNNPMKSFKQALGKERQQEQPPQGSIICPACLNPSRRAGKIPAYSIRVMRLIS